MERNIKLRYANTEFFNALLKRVAGICQSAGNKGREVLNIAMKDALVAGYISSNPIPETEGYPRRKPEIKILSKQQIKILLQAAEKSSLVFRNITGDVLWAAKGRNFRAEICRF